LTDPSPPPSLQPGHRLLLALIVLGGSIVRFADLDHCPNGFFRDEVEKGYNAWALATSGGAIDLTPGGFDLTPSAADPPSVRWRRWPFMINVMGVKTSALYQYASMPFVGLWGLSVGTTRMAAALAGALTILAAGWLFMRAWGPWQGLAIALWITLSPWHLVFSRWALQGIFVPLLMTLTLIGVFGLERQRRWAFPLIGAALGLMFYAYSGAQPLVLAWGACLVLLYRRSLKWAWALWVGVGLFLVPAFPSLVVRLTEGGSQRLARVAIWNEEGATAVSVTGRFIFNYITHFGPNFLFFNGDALPRHSIPEMGQMTLVDMALLPIGLIWTLRRRRPLAGALLAAFLCGPIPAALTREGIPHALRSIGMLTPAVAWSGVGLAVLAGWLASKVNVPPAEAPAGRRRSASLNKGQVYGLAVVAACAVVGLSGVWRYWKTYRGPDSPLVQIAFQNGERLAWETIAQQKQPGQRVYVHAGSPYSAYYQLFFTRRHPHDAAFRGLAADDFVYHDPSRQTPDQVWEGLDSGDWLLEVVHPASVRLTGGGPWITPLQATRIREAWVITRHKP